MNAYIVNGEHIRIDGEPPPGAEPAPVEFADQMRHVVNGELDQAALTAEIADRELRNLKDRRESEVMARATEILERGFSYDEKVYRCSEGVLGRLKLAHDIDAVIDWHTRDKRTETAMDLVARNAFRAAMSVHVLEVQQAAEKLKVVIENASLEQLETTNYAAQVPEPSTTP